MSYREVRTNYAQSSLFLLKFVSIVSIRLKNKQNIPPSIFVQISKNADRADLVEMLRALSYPRIISMENFRKPNFKLVAELLEWIVKRFAPAAHLPESLASEPDRIIFVKTAVLALLQNARIKLNPKKLYQADGYAVQELIIPIRMLYESPRKKTNDEGAAAWKGLKSKVNSQLQNVQACRQLAVQIPPRGASIYDLLAKELLAREARSKALSFALNLTDVEKAIKESISTKQEELAEIEAKLQNVSADEAALDDKIARRRSEYEQHQKRLAKLQAFRPQHMDEYEKYEKRLKYLYESYVLKFRNLSYLQYLLREASKSEQVRNTEAEQNIRNLIERRRAEELAKAKNQIIEPEATEAGRREGNFEEIPGTKVFGNITGAGLIDEDEDEDEYDVSQANNEEGSSEDEEIEKDAEPSRLRDDSVADTTGGEDEKLELSSNDDF